MAKKSNEQQQEQGSELRGTPVIGDSTPVEVVITGDAKHHKEGEKVKVSKGLADRMVKAGWAKFAILMIGFLFAFQAQSQSGPTLYSLTTTGLSSGVDSVVLTNSGTSVLSIKKNGPAQTSAVQLVIRKASGTAAGTASLYGSLDGVNYSTISSTTFSLTNVTSQNTIWVLSNSPVLYYRVTVTGSNTQSCYLHAKLLSH